jgi:hypothetical protein
MRRVLLRSAVLVILAAILGGHISELFDHWDHTLRTGRDADYTVVLVAACVGVAFLGVRKAMPAPKKCLRNAERMCLQASPAVLAEAEEVATPGPSPPLLLPIRI